jgi:hypothetical protein
MLFLSLRSSFDTIYLKRIPAEVTVGLQVKFLLSMSVLNAD